MSLSDTKRHNIGVRKNFFCFFVLQKKMNEKIYFKLGSPQ